MLILIACLLTLGAVIHLTDLIGVDRVQSRWVRSLELLLGLLQLAGAGWCWAQIFGWW